MLEIKKNREIKIEIFQINVSYLNSYVLKNGIRVTNNSYKYSETFRITSKVIRENYRPFTVFSLENVI